MDEIYFAIIKHLIITKQLNESENTIKLLESIGMESFYITNTFFEGLKKLFDKDQKYIQKYEITKFQDIFDKDIISFYYVLFKYILKNELYIYQLPFLLETRNKICYFIRRNLISLKENINGLTFKVKVKDVLNYFIIFEYYQTKGKQLNNSMKNSNFGPSNDYNRNSRVVSDSVSVSQDSNMFDGSSYRKAKEQSLRSVDKFEEEEKQEENFSEDDPVYKFLKHSIFIFHTNRKGQKPSIIYEEISDAKKTKKYTFEEITKLKSENGRIMENYEEFLKILETIESRITNRFTFKFKVKITLIFKIISENNNKFNMECTYTVELPHKEPIDFLDDNILEKGLISGLPNLMSEINSDEHKNLVYED
jgi:hypothetical protein